MKETLRIIERVRSAHNVASDTNASYRLWELIELQKKKKSVSNFNWQADPAEQSGADATTRIVSQNEEFIVINPQHTEGQSKIR